MYLIMLNISKLPDIIYSLRDSEFQRGVDEEIFAVLFFYTGYVGSCLPTFRYRQ
jgi:hypothetical protein